MSEIINNEYNVPEIEVNPQELNSALKHFNWGVFGFTWLWGLGNGSFRKTWPAIIVDFASGFLNIIPFIGWLLGLGAMVAIRVYFGMNGNTWAFNNRAWWSLTDFEETQKRWAVATAIIVGFTVFTTILAFIIIMFAAAANMGGAGGHY